MIRYMSVRVEVAVDVEPGTEREIGDRLAEAATGAVMTAIQAEGIVPTGPVASYLTNPQHAATVVRRA